MEHRSNIPIRLLLVEDDRALSKDLSGLLAEEADLKVIGVYGRAAEAQRAILREAVDIVVTDIQLPGPSGIDLIRTCKPQTPETQYLVLTMFEDDDLVFTALRAGASGYILKRNLRDQLPELIRDLHGGGSPMSSSIARKLVQEFQEGGTSEMEGLSPREQELLDLLARGRTYKECANEMSIKMDTLRTYIRRLYDKLHVHSRHEAVAKTRRRPKPSP